MEPLDKRRTRPARSNLQQPLRETASQTAGPYVHIGCLPNAFGIEGVFPEDLTSNKANGKLDGLAITIAGHVFDGEGALCKDMMLEFWHADKEGNFDEGVWGRAATDLQSGEYAFDTIMPGSASDIANRKLAPFITIMLFARGINLGLMTRLYFPQHEALLGNDPHFSEVEPARRQTLICNVSDTPDRYKFDIHLQGPNETVFFEA